MLPAFRSGKIKTLHGSSVACSGDLRARMSGITAASSCTSPMIRQSGRAVFACSVACTTLVTAVCLALPAVEKDNIATCGSISSNCFAVSAVATAILLSCFASGSITNAQSPITMTSLTGCSAFSNITKQLEIRASPSRLPTQRIALRTTSAVAVMAPATQPSASSAATIMQA